MNPFQSRKSAKFFNPFCTSSELLDLTKDPDNPSQNFNMTDDELSTPDFKENKKNKREEFKTSHKPFDYEQKRSLLNQNHPSELELPKPKTLKPSMEPTEEFAYFRIAKKDLPRFNEAANKMNSFLVNRPRLTETLKEKQESEASHPLFKAPEKFYGGSLAEHNSKFERINSSNNNKSKRNPQIFEWQGAKEDKSRVRNGLKSEFKVKKSTPNAEESIRILKSLRYTPKQDLKKPK